jgi:hypothetical protein
MQCSTGLLAVYTLQQLLRNTHQHRRESLLLLLPWPSLPGTVSCSVALLLLLRLGRLAGAALAARADLQL